ncbi:MAG: ABC transporter ATP-binding protein [Methanoregula sp.]|uniref:ABC transporter ATP-binding protein n=1 Tax=Methanoregula sp. TaxID=2052170 RepID=UPI003C1B3106
MNAISVRQLGKKFKLFPSPGARFLEYLSAGRLTRHTDFWALQDITFEVPAGTTLGILGQNGSGKSTLLSILAGVLEPSAGTFEIHGKVSAILELGSGFHPEFSGRDNVYMYGSIMGLSRADVDARYAEIVRFSELGDFIDQPLRTYSSGMIVRLAFSVAVNVNADILIVDEALAVGDAIFQHRCFRKIREMQEAGKTILYVGHDTDAVRNLCTSALLLDGGRIIERGNPNTVVNKYHALIAERERTYSEGTLSEHGEVPGEDYETIYDFARHLSDAKIESTQGVPVNAQTVEIQSVPRRVIFAHPPSKITYTVPVEPGSSLAFAIGILPAAWDKIPQGVKFDIDMVSDGATEPLFSRVLMPKRNIGDRGWHNFILSLEKYSGKTVSLVFRTSGSGEDLSYCWSAWGWGKIVKPELTISAKYSDRTLSSVFSSGEERFGNKRGEILLVELLDKDFNRATVITSGEIVHVRIHVVLHENIPENLTIGCTFKNKYCDIYGTNTKWQRLNLSNKKRGVPFVVEFSQPLKINTGTYSINAGLVIARSDNEIEVLDRRYDCLIFTVEKKGYIVGIVDFESSVKEIQI